MKNSQVLVAVLVLIVLSVHVSLAQGDQHSYIVKMKSPESGERMMASGRLPDMKPVFGFYKHLLGKVTNNMLKKETADIFTGLMNYFVFDLKEGNNENEILASLLSNPDVISISPNYIYHIEQSSPPNDPSYPQQWGLKAINAEKAWILAEGEGIIVGIVDTGIDFLHPDLVNNIWINKKEDINGNGTFEAWDINESRDGVKGDLNGLDEDGNGFTDDVVGYDFVDQYKFNIGDSKGYDPDPMDEMYHGTNVAGVIAAEKNNGIGIAGLAPKAKVMALRAFDFTGNGESDDIATAIVFAAQNGARVLNLSFGEYYSSPLIHDAIKYASSLGCVVVASSGNENSAGTHYPSDYNEVISVGASSVDRQKWGRSNYGSLVDILAPGEQIITTSPDSSYKTTQGTSFSAPHVSAAAALLLSLNPWLEKEDVIGVIRATSIDAGSPGWDFYNSAGLLDAAAALNAISESRITINYPANEVILDGEANANIAVIGNAATPLFDSYQVFIGEGKGVNINKWTPVSDLVRFQVMNDTLAVIDNAMLKDTVYTVRLVVNQKNHLELEERSYMEVMSSSSTLEFTAINSTPVWHGGKRKIAVTVTTNHQALVTIRVPDIGLDSSYISDHVDLSRVHTLLIDPAIRSKEFPAEVIATRSDGKTIKRIIWLKPPDDPVSFKNFTRKPYTLPLSYLYNETANLYGDGKDAFGVIDITSGSLEETKIYKYENSAFILKELSADTHIPVGYGDSNGDGILEMFTKVFGTSTLYQPKSTGDKVLSNIIFADTLHTFWAAGMADLTGDGRDELFAYSDTAFHVISYRNGTYEEIARTNPNPKATRLGTFPGLAIANFDADANMELCYSNENGNVFIYEYVNNSLRLEFVDSNFYSGSQQYMTAADVDNDGTKEILLLNSGIQANNNGGLSSGEQLWNFRILKNNGNDSYYDLWVDNAFGVREGPTYKNGIAAGNLDGQPGDEIVFSVFPDLYVFKWNDVTSKPEVFWYYPYVFSNTALINDFDKNGINELGFSTFQATEFYEFDRDIAKLPAPGGLDGWSIDENSAYLQWNKVDRAELYNIYIADGESDSLRFTLTAITNENSITIDTLHAGSYFFAVTAWAASMTESAPAGPLWVYLHKPVEPVIAIAKDSIEIIVTFLGKVGESPISPGVFTVSSQNMSGINPFTVNRLNDTSLLLSFIEPFEPGTYNMSVSSFRDFYNSPTVSSVLTFEILQKQLPEPELFLKYLNVINNHRLQLGYSEPVDQASASVISNYILIPSGDIVSIIFDPEKPGEVIIELDPASTIGALGKNYTLTVVNVKSQSGSSITSGAGNTLGFVFAAEDLNSAFVYPNPIRLNENPRIFFANLSPFAEISILTLEGETIANLKENDGNGGVVWNGILNNGNMIESGVYLFKVTGQDKDGNQLDETLKKFVVIK